MKSAPARSRLLAAFLLFSASAASISNDGRRFPTFDCWDACSRRGELTRSKLLSGTSAPVPWRNLRVQPKIAFSRFPPIRTVAPEGQLRVKLTRSQLASPPRVAPWCNLRLPPKTAFPRFPLVVRADLGSTLGAQ